MRVLVACEESQAVCIAFREQGHEAYSCDIQLCSGGHPEWHIQDDALVLISEGGVGPHHCPPAMHLSDRRRRCPIVQCRPYHCRPGAP